MTALFMVLHHPSLPLSLEDSLHVVFPWDGQLNHDGDLDWKRSSAIGTTQCQIQQSYLMAMLGPCA